MDALKWTEHHLSTVDKKIKQYRCGVPYGNDVVVEVTDKGFDVAYGNCVKVDPVTRENCVFETLEEAKVQALLWGLNLAMDAVNHLNKYLTDLGIPV